MNKTSKAKVWPFFAAAAWYFISAGICFSESRVSGAIVRLILAFFLLFVAIAILVQKAKSNKKA